MVLLVYYEVSAIISPSRRDLVNHVPPFCKMLNRTGATICDDEDACRDYSTCTNVTTLLSRFWWFKPIFQNMGVHLSSVYMCIHKVRFL